MSKPIFDFAELELRDDYYIVHLLDDVRMGRLNEEEESGDTWLSQAIRDDRVIEAHFFNAQRELYLARDGEQLVLYAPMEHSGLDSESVERKYKLDRHFKKTASPYKTLVVREYLDYKDNLAFVAKTVLYGLEEGMAE
ncbi:hypothetical protein IDH44_17835 [Paenibacillus sp. IB182496]|uniref:Uncharacterized protein n=1 Tax=Paenibacillus sabuli TaxID=2772509 RepID=A0A927BUH5_9BACL|nr:hypothetical protein [Paenibacillus sabuli]MBD2847062.1 hypothetical protein [Paenibacillus sabuli]